MAKNYLSEFYAGVTAKQPIPLKPGPVPAKETPNAKTTTPTHDLIFEAPSDNPAHNRPDRTGQPERLLERVVRSAGGAMPVLLSGVKFCEGCGADLAGRVPRTKFCLKCSAWRSGTGWKGKAGSKTGPGGRPPFYVQSS